MPPKVYGISAADVPRLRNVMQRVERTAGSGTSERMGNWGDPKDHPFPHGSEWDFGFGYTIDNQVPIFLLHRGFISGLGTKVITDNYEFPLDVSQCQNKTYHIAICEIEGEYSIKVFRGAVLPSTQVAWDTDFKFTYTYNEGEDDEYTEERYRFLMANEDEHLTDREDEELEDSCKVKEAVRFLYSFCVDDTTGALTYMHRHDISFGVKRFDELTDVEISDLADKDGVLYDETSERWINVPTLPLEDDASGLLPVGPVGPAGTAGTNAINGQDGINGTDGSDGADGADGAPGADSTVAGPPGVTPVVATTDGYWQNIGDNVMVWIPATLTITTGTDVQGPITLGNSATGQCSVELKNTGTNTGAFQLKGDLATPTSGTIQSGVSGFIYGADSAGGNKGWYSSQPAILFKQSIDFGDPIVGGADAGKVPVYLKGDDGSQTNNNSLYYADDATSFRGFLAIDDKKGIGVTGSPKKISLTVDTTMFEFDATTGALKAKGGGAPANENTATIGDSATTEGTADTAESTTFTATGTNALTVYMVSRVAYNEAGDKTLYGYKRLLQFDKSGRLYKVGGEIKYTIDVPTTS